MSNKTQLSNNNTQLASLIQELQGKAAGGGGASVETCSVNLQIVGGVAYTVGYTTVNEDGNVIGVTETQQVGKNIKCVCNTHITITHRVTTNSCNTDKAEVLYNAMLSGLGGVVVVAINAQAGETAAVTVIVEQTHA